MTILLVILAASFGFCLGVLVSYLKSDNLSRDYPQMDKPPKNPIIIKNKASFNDPIVPDEAFNSSDNIDEFIKKLQ